MSQISSGFTLVLDWFRTNISPRVIELPVPITSSQCMTGSDVLFVALAHYDIRSAVAYFNWETCGARTDHTCRDVHAAFQRWTGGFVSSKYVVRASPVLDSSYLI
jgi:hypothetical protein